jgi:hypothetical protein
VSGAAAEATDFDESVVERSGKPARSNAERSVRGPDTGASLTNPTTGTPGAALREFVAAARRAVDGGLR